MALKKRIRRGEAAWRQLFSRQSRSGYFLGNSAYFTWKYTSPTTNACCIFIPTEHLLHDDANFHHARITSVD
jgi:hypothetical protein